MKINIFDKTIVEIGSKDKTLLFGLRKHETVIINSTEEKSGLKPVGFFQSSLIQNIKPKKNDGVFFSLDEDNLKCFVSKLGKLIPAEYKILKYQTDFNKRNKGIFDNTVLQKPTILIIGLGSGGSQIIIDLVRCGVTNFIIVDPDTISLSNICRSTYTLFDIGRKKIDVIPDQILSINPNVNITAFDEDITEMEFEKLEEIIRSSDLIIEGTDSQKAKVLINGIAHKTKPVFYPAVYELGSGGDILMTLPGLPCYECVFSSIIGVESGQKKREWDYTSGHAKPMPALISDIQIVVSRTVKLVLALLTAGTDFSFFDKVTEPGCTLLRIYNEKSTQDQFTAFSEEWLQTSIDQKCTCQTLR